MYEKYEKCIQNFYFEHLKGNEYLRELGLDGMESGCQDVNSIHVA
jgi:hypothetical protein